MVSLKSDHIDKETIGMLRTIHQKQVQLISLADQKANILMGVIIIGLSIIATNFFTYDYQNNSNIQNFLILCFSLSELISLLFAVWVITPRLVKEKKNQDISKSKNPLFFMESSNISEEKYVKYMLEQIKSPKRVYELMLIDFYQIGFVLKEKYKYLSISYILAILGIVPAVILIILVFLNKS